MQQAWEIARMRKENRTSLSEAMKESGIVNEAREMRWAHAFTL
jgi:hypothetical protein